MGLDCFSIQYMSISLSKLSHSVYLHTAPLLFWIKGSSFTGEHDCCLELKLILHCLLISRWGRGKKNLVSGGWQEVKCNTIQHWWQNISEQWNKSKAGFDQTASCWRLALWKVFKEWSGANIQQSSCIVSHVGTSIHKKLFMDIICKTFILKCVKIWKPRTVVYPFISFKAVVWRFQVNYWVILS